MSQWYRTRYSNKTVNHNSRRLSWACAALGVWIAVLPAGYAADIPEEYLEAVHHAEAEGSALYDADMKGSAANQEQIADAKTRISSFCDFSYIPVRVTENGEDVLFFLAQPRSDAEIVVGRHFRVAGTEVQQSTRSCLAVGLGTPSHRPVAIGVTHLLAATPSVFHVYLSLKYKIGLDVGTSVGNWAVEHGSITFLGARAPPPPK